MTHTDTQGTEEFVDRYVAVWKRAGPQARRKLIGALWSNDGIELTDESEYRGHEAIGVHIEMGG
jgi:hypothetical protein